MLRKLDCVVLVFENGVKTFCEEEFGEFEMSVVFLCLDVLIIYCILFTK